MRRRSMLISCVPMGSISKSILPFCNVFSAEKISKSQSWRSTRVIRGFKEEKRPDGWRGALAENGIYDKYGETLPTYNMSAEYTYWEITIPCADRDIELLFELREWTNTEGTGMSYCDGAVVIGYAE